MNTVVDRQGAVETLIAPVSNRIVCGGRVRVLTFGMPNNFAKLAENPDPLRTILGWAGLYGVNEVFAPNPIKFNAVVLDPRVTPFEIKVSVPSSNTSASLYVGHMADGVLLPQPGMAAFLTSGDCPTTLVRFPDGIVGVAHSGRDCLVDRDAIRGKAPRAHESVIHALLAHYKTDWQIPASERQEFYSAVFCSVAAVHFPHNFGLSDPNSENSLLIARLVGLWGSQCIKSKRSGGIDLVATIRSQLSKAGVSADSEHFFHDGVDTFGDQHEGRHVWHSVRRDGKDEAGRNGILAIRLE